MSAISIFSFENSELRTSGTPESPLFVATDLAAILGYSNARKAIYAHVDPEDLIKSEIETNGGRQTVNCVNESGLYALIFGSKLESAKRFKRWVTSEVLPAIRRNGKYETPDFNTAKITEYQQWELQKAVAKRAKNTAAHYQTIYHAIYNRFQSPRYTELKQRDFEDCIAFIEDVDLTVPTAEPVKPQEPELPLEKKGGIYLTDGEADGMVATICYFRHLFRPIFDTTYQFLRAVNSPMQKEYYNAAHEIGLATLSVQQTLAKHGHDVKQCQTYKHVASRRDPEQGSYFKATDISTEY